MSDVEEAVTWAQHEEWALTGPTLPAPPWLVSDMEATVAFCRRLGLTVPHANAAL